MASYALPPTDNVLATKYPGFNSFKTTSSIHYPQRWLRDALIQASLDPYTITLSPSATPIEDLPRPVEFAFLRRTVVGSGMVLVTQLDADIPDLVDDTMRPTVITRRDLKRDPMLTASRTIWSSKRLSVEGADRYRVIEAVDRRGSAPMHEIVGVVQNLSVDPFRQICSLLANSYLIVDLRAALGPDSVLTLGPASTSASAVDAWYPFKGPDLP